MSEKRRGLGKGLGALIPTAPADGRPVDVFFPNQRTADRAGNGETTSVVTPTERSLPSSQPDSAAQDGAKRSTAASGQAAGKKESTPRTRAGTKRAQIPADTLAPRHQRSSSPTSAEAPAGDTPKALAPAAQSGTRSSDTELVAVPGASFAEVSVDDVVANRRQPRQVFDEEELEELAASIREVGVLQPIVVRPLPDSADARYELIMGERRWRASQLAGGATVPAIIRQVDDNDLLRDALLENLHRAQLNPLEEAAAYQQLLDDFDCTHEELAVRITRSRPQISNTLRLLKLPPLVQRRVAAGVLTAGHARALLGLSDPAAMERLAQRIVAEGLSVRTTEEIVALGDEPIAPEMRRRPRSDAHTAELNELATRLSDQFDTRVKVGMGQRKGKINIEFASLDDLNRILEVLAPNVERLEADSPVR